MVAHGLAEVRQRQETNMEETWEQREPNQQVTVYHLPIISSSWYGKEHQYLVVNLPEDDYDQADVVRDSTVF